MKSVFAFCLLLLFIAGAIPAGAEPSLVYSTSLPGASDLAVDSAGNAYALGERFVAKLSPSGELIFQRPLELPDRYPLAIAIDPAGYIYIAGTRNLSDPAETWGSEANEAFVAKLSPDGTGVIYESSIWEGDSTEGIDVAVDALGRAYLHYQARTRYSSELNTVVRFSPAGSDKLWVGGRARFISAMALGPSGDLFTVGWADPEDSQADWYFLLNRTDAVSGADIETLRGDNETFSPWVVDVAATPGDGSVVVGTNSEGLYVAELGPAGEEVFSRALNLGGRAEVRDVAVTSSGQIVLAGAMGDNPLRDPFLLRLEGGTGEVVSSMDFGDDIYPYPMAVAVGPGGDAYVVLDGYVSRFTENRPPVCSGATASPSTIWPPDRRQVRISTLGVTDPNGDPVTLKVTRILQDELFTARMADAGSLGTAKPWVRADRMDNGDGRVYHLFFEATDPAGAKCTGVVKVCVPIQSGGTCRDGGARIDSTMPR